MVVVVFAFALSFLGVWEVPIPGFAQSKSSSKLQQQEGPAGAFFKGIFTTLLATPCSGPFLGPVFALHALAAAAGHLHHLRQRRPRHGLAVSADRRVSRARALAAQAGRMDGNRSSSSWASCSWAPSSISSRTISAEYFIPTLALIIGVWFACWIIGRVPIYEDHRQASPRLGDRHHGCRRRRLGRVHLPRPSEAPLRVAAVSRPKSSRSCKSEGKTVMVDFTADWCPTCQTNFRFAINTPA